MFVPFIAATIGAAALIKLGALAVWVTVLSLALKTMSLVFATAALSVLALFLWSGYHRRIR